jgi:hypothetical protein
MSFDVNGTVVLLALLVPAGLFLALATAPRWVVRSMAKHALWRLRDDLAEDIRNGSLPGDNAAVQELIARVDWAIREARLFDLLHLLLWRRAKRSIPRETVRLITKKLALTGLDRQQATLVERYRGRFDSVAIKGLLLSSWFGLAMALWFSLQIAARGLALRLLRGLSKRPRSLVLPLNVRFVVREAADNVAFDTNIGRDAREFVTSKGPSRILA